MKLSKFLSATALAGAALAAPQSAWAQTTTAGTPGSTTTPAPSASTTEPLQTDPTAPVQTTRAGDASGDDQIVVTGSRIARPNLDSSVPITSLTVADLIDTGDVSLGDTLNQLPSLRATFSQANSTRFIGTAGLNLLDLRGLGTERTLVLVNGRRHVTSTPGSYEVDVNTIPNALLERVDIVTGGTSAVYGSDAIAGVVNFVLKRDYDGVEARFQGGISDKGDRGSYLASIVAGKNFADNRGNIAVAAEYARSNPVYFTDRDNQTGAYSGVPGFSTNEYTLDEFRLPNASDGIPDTAFFARPGTRFTNRSLGGTVATACPATTAVNAAVRRALLCTGLRAALAPNAANPAQPFGPNLGAELQNYYLFADDGTLVRNVYDRDNRSIGGGVFGGQTATGLEGAMLLPGLERINTNVLANFEVSPALRFFAEGKYVHIKANQTSTQPTFNGGLLTNQFFLDNPFLTAQNVSTLQTILGTTSTTAAFTLNRFNNDIGTRAENHTRELYRFVGGIRGDISTVGNLNYEISGNYGRSTTFYKTGGNVDVAKFNAASNAVRNAAGQIVCRVNADAITTNDMPGCTPLNLFGQYRSSQAALDYVLFTSTRNQWAEQIDAVASLSGDSSGLFSLPGGNVGFSIGAEYRREDAFSGQDAFTQSGATFLNGAATFDPQAVAVYEGFGELRVPLIRDQFIHELTLEGAGRYSKYSTAREGVWAYNFGAVFSPVADIRFRAGYARAVRAPNLGDLYATAAQTFANGLVDPCSTSQLSQNPNRARNCAAAGVPTTTTYTQDNGQTVTVAFENTPSSGVLGINQGNLNLTPETSKSLTIGGIFEPRFLPGLAISVDYYDIKVENVISGLSGQGIIDRCYDDPVSINNPFCAAVFRRTSGNSVANGTFAGQIDRAFPGVAAPVTIGRTGNAFLNQPFNYAALKTSGIDGDISYNHLFDNGVRVSYRGLVSWLAKREAFTFIAAPNQSTRLHGTLGDPEWRGRFSTNFTYKNFDFGYDLNYIGKMAIATWETQFTHQGRGPTNADAFPFRTYAPQLTHDVQLGVRVNEQYRFYFGVDNFLDTLPPYGLTGTGGGGGIYGVTGRFFSAGVNVRY